MLLQGASTSNNQTIQNKKSNEKLKKKFIAKKDILDGKDGLYRMLSKDSFLYLYLFENRGKWKDNGYDPIPENKNYETQDNKQVWRGRIQNILDICKNITNKSKHFVY